MPGCFRAFSRFPGGRDKGLIISDALIVKY